MCPLALPTIFLLHKKKLRKMNVNNLIGTTRLTQYCYTVNKCCRDSPISFAICSANTFIFSGSELICLYISLRILCSCNLSCSVLVFTTASFMSDEIKSRSSAALATLRILNCRICARSCCCSSKTAFSLLGFSSHAVSVISKE